MAIDNETEGLEAPEPPKPRQKSEVNYRPGKNEEDCLGCEFFEEPDRCSRVRGEISPTGVCDLWESPNSIDGLEFGDSESIEDILFGSGGGE